MNRAVKKFVGVSLVVGTILTILTVNSFIDASASVDAVKPVEVVEPVEIEQEYIETVSIDAPTKIVYHETVTIKDAYYDEQFSSHYAIADGWALESYKDASDIVGKDVKVRFYVVNGEEIILGWGVVDENGNYELEK